MSTPNNTLIELIKVKLKTTRKANLLGMIAIAVMCCFFLGMVYFIDAQPNTSGSYVRIIIGVAAALGLVFCYFGALQHKKKFDPETSKVIQMLESNNADEYFVWIYPYKLVYNGVPSYAIVFKTRDKKEFSISVKAEEQTPILTMLHLTVKNVTYGFSEERKAIYKANPTDLLLKDKQISI